MGKEMAGQASSISRKQFLTGAGIGAVALAGAAVGIASADESEATEETTEEEAAEETAEEAAEEAEEAAAEEETSSAVDYLGNDVASVAEIQDLDAVIRGSYQVDMTNVEPFPSIAEPAAYDYETDVVLVGYGVGGTQAGLTALNRGLSVIACERSDNDHWYEHAGVGFYWIYGGEEWLEQEGIETWDEDYIREWIADRASRPVSTSDMDTLVHYYLEMPKAFEQVREEVADKTTFRLAPELLPSFEHDPMYKANHETLEEEYGVSSPIGSYFVIEEYIKDSCVERGMQVLWGTRVTNLIMNDEGTVVGVKAVDQDSNIVYIKAGAVIDCVGGYGSNYDMVKFLGGSVDQMLGHNVGPIVNDGAGIRLCQGAGAGLRGGPCADSYADGGLDAIGLGLQWNLVLEAEDVPNFFTSCIYTPIVMGRQPTLKVNKYGQRFMDEDGTWTAKVREAYKQPDHRYFTIFDGRIDEYINELYVNQGRGGACEFPYTFMGQLYLGNGQFASLDTTFEDNWQEGLDKGYIVQADTLEELAEVCGINGDNFVATVERYNELCELGEDEDFGKLSGCLWSISEPPYYAMERMPGFAWDMGEVLASDMDGRVLDPSGYVIPGLYCGANDASLIDYGTGEFFQDGLIAGGSAHAIDMGWLAGNAAADDLEAAGAVTGAIVENEPTGTTMELTGSEASQAGQVYVSENCNVCHSTPTRADFADLKSVEDIVEEFSDHDGISVSEEDAENIAAWALEQ